ncbi:MAG: hypothetical protein CL489_03200 [Acidobacteria bacterium]|nr:hypothetical protein [Acidobacteriota bacterium]
MKTFEEFQVWNKRECEELREIALDHEPVRASADIRQATRYWIDGDLYTGIFGPLHALCDKHNFWDFQMLWSADALPSLEVIHYKAGDFYKPHTDWGGKYKNRKLSFSVQLSDSGEYLGGDVALFDGPEPWKLTRKQGWATLWPSWTLHEVEPVAHGERWAAVGWLLGPQYC